MKYFYISSPSGHSGISRYSAVFFEQVLRSQGYIYIDSSDDLSSIFTRVSSADRVHIEIGIFQVKETEILLLMLQANYKNVSITMHDAPLLKYPMTRFKNPLLNKISKFNDQYISRFRNATDLIRKIKTVFVLTHKGMEESDKIYKTGNFKYLPHIINSHAAGQTGKLPNRNFLYLGFIGKNKGIEYALKLHAGIIKSHPDILFYIAGTALGKQKEYYQYLKKKYTKNVHFLGYVYEEDLSKLYSKTKFAFLLFRDYRFFYPASGSILNCMNQEQIVLTNPTNAIPEIITNGENGLFVTGDLKKDLIMLDSLFEDNELQEKIMFNAKYRLEKEHGTDVVAHYFFGELPAPVNAGNFQ